MRRKENKLCFCLVICKIFRKIYLVFNKHTFLTNKTMKIDLILFSKKIYWIEKKIYIKLIWEYLNFINLKIFFLFKNVLSNSTIRHKIFLLLFFLSTLVLESLWWITDWNWFPSSHSFLTYIFHPLLFYHWRIKRGWEGSLYECTSFKEKEEKKKRISSSIGTWNRILAIDRSFLLRGGLIRNEKSYRIFRSILKPNHAVQKKKITRADYIFFSCCRWGILEGSKIDIINCKVTW